MTSNVDFDDFKCRFEAPNENFNYLLYHDDIPGLSLDDI